MRDVVVAGRYRIIESLDGALGDVEIAHTPARRAGWTAELERDRLALVDRFVAAGRPLLTDADGSLPLLYRLDGVEVDRTNGTTALVLRTSETDYAEHLLTNVEHPQWRADRGAAVMADAVGVSAVVRSNDGQIIVGRRSARTHEGRGDLHVAPSGHPHPPQSIRAALHAELGEELGIEPGALAEETVTGVVRALPSGKPEVTSRFVARLSLAEIVESWTSAEERWEFDALEALAWEPRRIESWLLGNVTEIVAPGHAAIALAGRVDFGARWLEGVVSALSE